LKVLLSGRSVLWVARIFCFPAPRGIAENSQGKCAEFLVNRRLGKNGIWKKRIFRLGRSPRHVHSFPNHMPEKTKDPRPFKRAVLKLSGEALREPGSTDNISPEIVQRIASEIKEAVDGGLQLAIVVGGGNFWRGAAASARGMDRATADYVGMLATVMNAIAVQNALERMGIETRVQSAIPMASVCEPYIRRRAERHMQKGRIVIFAAGTGNPYFTTDTAAALRAAEMNCDALLKGTSVDGVYDADPKKVPTAKRYEHLSFDRVLADNLKVMDAAAVALCRENDIPIVVFNIRGEGNLASVLRGEGTSTIVNNLKAETEN